ncbi:divergent P-loop NTPase [Acanthamoeba polyphaga moumouvirus]|uniref:Divergent P-loop NTPase n=2 Tax=Moumouvirus TaxID=3080801 RepID=L7RCC3_9VIRU|nr:divergent P-loop NTPase [Acanthamoeba polyphaga moumouvirus]AEX63280.1 hypothetical protein mv_R1078 [Moumouvirus Monve]AGC01593.1 divergent P-loop NTPase [Acanthamoeba polyphaga moumouvirus]AQN67918.1 divergent P-loop NTpase [Saudi moumouvirus]
MSTPILIDYNKLKLLKEYAENNIIKMDEIMNIYHGKAEIIGNRIDHCVFFDFGYKFVYSIEEVPSTDFKKFYTIKKLSGSVNNGNYPSVELMKIIMNELDMKDLSECNIKINKNDPIPNIEIMDIIKETSLV